MSSDELSRLVNDVMTDPSMVAEAMAITDQPAMEAYITDKGYGLTPEEMDEVWAMTAKVLAGHGHPMGTTEQLIRSAKGGI